MSFLRKRKNEEIEEEEYEEPVRRSRNKSLKDSQFKDLKSENKRKRKEPPKPWGKKERLLILILLAATAGTSGILALSSRVWKLPGLPRFAVPKLSAISLPFFGEETIVIEKKPQTEDDRRKSEEVVKLFKGETSGLTGVYGMYFVNLKTGYSYGIYEDEEFEPASLNKLPVMVGMYREAEKGNLDLETKYSLKSSDKVGGSGSLYGKPAGIILTYRDLVRYMGNESDNTAVTIARRTLGKEKIEATIDAIGMENTVALGEEQKTTPRDIGILFKELYENDLLSEDNSREILDFMTDTVYESWLAAGIPSGTKVAHKFGREVHVVNDGGIVFVEDPFVLVILSKGVVEMEADNFFPNITRKIYEVYTRN